MVTRAKYANSDLRRQGREPLRPMPRDGEVAATMSVSDFVGVGAVIACLVGGGGDEGLVFDQHQVFYRRRGSGFVPAHVLYIQIVYLQFSFCIFHPRLFPRSARGQIELSVSFNLAQSSWLSTVHVQCLIPIRQSPTLPRTKN